MLKSAGFFLQHQAAAPPPPTPAAFATGLAGWWESDYGVTVNGTFPSKYELWVSKTPSVQFAHDAAQTAGQLPNYNTASGDDRNSIQTLNATGGYASLADGGFNVTTALTVIVACRLSASAANAGVIFAASANDVGQSFICNWYTDASVEFLGPANVGRVSSSLASNQFVILSVRCSPQLAATVRVNRVQKSSGGTASTQSNIDVPFRIGCAGDEAGQIGQPLAANYYAVAFWKIGLTDSQIDGVERYFLQRLAGCNH